MAMQHLTIAKALGLYTNPNQLSLPEGALTLANNAVIDRPGVVSMRQGWADTGMTAISGEIPTAGEVFQDYLVFQHATSKISRLTGSTRTAYSETFTPPTLTKMRFAQAGGSLFATSTTGIQKLDVVTGSWRIAGPPQALDGTVTLNKQSVTVGPMTPNTQVAYRGLWGYKDANKRIELGAVSGRIHVSNPAGVSAVAGTMVRTGGNLVTVTIAAGHGLVTNDIIDVTPGEANFAAGAKTVTRTSDTVFTYAEAGANVSNSNTQTLQFSTRGTTLTLLIPSGVTTNYFFQLFRSELAATASTEPSDELQQVYEYVPNNVDISNGYFSITDICPDALRGEALYTNPSQEGAEASNDRPPAAYDVCEFNDMLIFANTSGKQALDYQLLAIGVSGTTRPGLIQNDTFIINAADNGAVASAQGWVAATVVSSSITADPGDTSGNFGLYTWGTPSQNIANTTKSLVRAINRLTSGSYYAFYTSGPYDPPGRFRVVTRSIATAAFGVVTQATGARAVFSPNLPVLANMSAVLQRAAGTTVTATLTLGTYGVVAGQSVYIITASVDANYPSGTKTVLAVNVGAGTFTYTEAGTNAAGPSGAALFGGVTASVFTSYTVTETASDNAAFPNSVMWSKFGDYTAVPAAYIDFLGAKDKKVLRVVPQRSCVWVFKEDGLWRLTGRDEFDIDIQPFDRNCVLFSPESAVPAGHYVYAMTLLGAVRVSEAGVENVSGPIENDLLNFLGPFRQSDAATRNGFAYACHGAYDPVNQRYMMYLSTGGYYVYNIRTSAWTYWPRTKAQFLALDRTVDKLYLGTAVADADTHNPDNGKVSYLNNDRTSSTYVDLEPALTVTITAVVGGVATISAAVALGYTGYAITQGSARAVITGTPTSTTLTYSDYNQHLVPGTAYFCPPIAWAVEYAPLTLGDASTMKHFSEIRPILESAPALTALTIGFTGREAVTTSVDLAFTTATDGPIRVLVPLERQRGPYLKIKFSRTYATEAPSIGGFGYSAEVTSVKSWRSSS